MKRKIILIEQKNIVECDNKKCDYSIPNHDPNLRPPSKDLLLKYIDKPCPKCGENILTKEDYNDFNSLMKTINWVNKWFGWLSIFHRQETMEYETGEIKIHNGVKIKKYD